MKKNAKFNKLSISKNIALLLEWFCFPRNSKFGCFLIFHSSCNEKIVTLRQRSKEREIRTNDEDWLSGGYKKICREFAATTFLCYVDFSIFLLSYNMQQNKTNITSTSLVVSSIFDIPSVTHNGESTKMIDT